jgi:FKBP-type peptidyl-prolyl cis-trans isomerase
MRRTIWVAAAAAATMALGGCLGGGPVEPTCATGQIPTVAGDTIAVGETGVRYLTMQTGTGAAVSAGNLVLLHYTGYLQDGTVFGTSRGGSPTILEMNRVIPGFRDGVVGMREGGRRLLIIPPAQGYGAAPQPCIPANSTLLFDVEVIQTASGG